MGTSPYTKLMAMLAASFIIMYGVMFLNVADVAHIHLSLTRTYMSLLMVSPMALLMVVGMGKMYPDKKRNGTIITVAIALIILAFIGLRRQVPIGDEQYMRAMIPHHSSAIMTSRNASIRDPEVRALADTIIASQQREIQQMERILKRMGK